MLAEIDGDGDPEEGNDAKGVWVVVRLGYAVSHADVVGVADGTSRNSGGTEGAIVKDGEPDTEGGGD